MNYKYVCIISFIFLLVQIRRAKPFFQLRGRFPRGCWNSMFRRIFFLFYHTRGGFCSGDWQFSTHVTWYRHSRYEASHFTTWELATMNFSFSTRSTWSTASKAFEGSNKTAPVKTPLSRLCILNLLQVDFLAIELAFLGRPTDEVARGRPFVPRHIKSD